MYHCRGLQVVRDASAGPQMAHTGTGNTISTSPVNYNMPYYPTHINKQIIGYEYCSRSCRYWCRDERLYHGMRRHFSLVGDRNRIAVYLPRLYMKL